jgi:hypothetical protein
MLQIVALLVAFAAVVTGITTIRKGEVKLSNTTTLRGRSATIAGIVVILIGLGFAGFALLLPYIFLR